MAEEQDSRTSLDTIAVHSGDWAVKHPGRPGAMPIYQTTAFAFDNLEDVEGVHSGELKGWMYYRVSNPNRSAFEEAFAQLEGAEMASATASGMGAIFAALITATGAGTHIISDKVIYGSTYGLLTQHLPRLGIETTFVDTSDPAAVRAAVRPNTKVLYFESISNPMIGIPDFASIANLGRELNLTTMVDGTFAPPYLVRPCELGIDVVMHATTKYIGGHSDALGGMMVGRKDFITQAASAAMMFGATLSPFDAWLNVRSLKTLPLRMQAHSRNARIVAEWLEEQAKVSKVYYPGLKSHPQHALAVRQFPKGFGGMLSFELKDGNHAKASRFINALQHIPFMPSLADVSTTINYPASTSHRFIPYEERVALGITDGLLRLSVGIEDPSDIIRDLETAFAAL